MQEDAQRALQEWEDSIKERELAEKRRVAPGWLDREEKILEPEKKRDSSLAPAAGQSQYGNIMDSQDPGPVQRSLTEQQAAEGEELDRAFGGMGQRQHA